MGTRRTAHATGRAITGLILAGGLACGVTGLAGAAPRPSVRAAQSIVNADQARYDMAAQRYDEASTQLIAARDRLAQVSSAVAADLARYAAARRQVAAIAAASYEGPGTTSLAGLFTASDPGLMLSMASVITELVGARTAQAQSFLTAARQLASVQRQRQSYESGIRVLVSQRAASEDSARQALEQETAVLASLTARQRAAVQQQAIGGLPARAITAPTAPGGTYGGPASTQGGKAVAFAYAQLGCRYVYGATGPCGGGFDCSGLVQAAWAAAGVTIPRDTYSQWAALPHISMSGLQPGDLIYYSGIGHVAMYVGGGYIIDAPRTGLTVEKIPRGTPWYAGHANGAVRP
jgi:peptidoglycan DL-endopeptidase CwlO